MRRMQDYWVIPIVSLTWQVFGLIYVSRLGRDEVNFILPHHSQVEYQV